MKQEMYYGKIYYTYEELKDVIEKYKKYYFSRMANINVLPFYCCLP